MRLRVTGVLLALALTACATPKANGPLVMSPPAPLPPSPVVEPPDPPAPYVQPLVYTALAGWDAEDHLAALKAYRSTCGVVKEPVGAEACRRARLLNPLDETIARRFLETHFRPESLGDAGLLTAYFAPVYEAGATPDEIFSMPVRSRPDDLAISAAGAVSQRVDGKSRPYPDREAIETEGMGQALAWMRPEDLFFLQIQGSGVLTFTDGTRKRAAFSAHNGLSFVGIARPMREQGLLKDSDTSGDAIRTWLATHRGEEADAIMRLNPRYVFFNLVEDDDRDPAGAAGVSLPAGRSVAVDTSRHAMGELLWIDASAPALTGAFPVYRRLVMALDTGGAIKGEVRADLYMGRGDTAGAEAGRVRHLLKMYRLVPIAPEGS